MKTTEPRRPGLFPEGEGLGLRLRAIVPADLEAFFAFQQDPEANRMAAFTARDPGDRAAFDAHWKRILANPAIVGQTITVGPEVVGSVLCYPDEGRREVTYWIARAHWGKGVATRALAAFLELVPERPLHARAAADNRASIRVLEKCGFVVIGAARGFANARGAEIDEVVMVAAG